MLEVLTEQDLHRIHDASLEILETNGVTFHESPEAAETLREHGCEVDGFRARYPRRLVEEALGLVPDRNQLSFDYAPLAVTEPMSLKKGESARRTDRQFILHLRLPEGLSSGLRRAGRGRQVPGSRQPAEREVRLLQSRLSFRTGGQENHAGFQQRRFRGSVSAAPGAGQAACVALDRSEPGHALDAPAQSDRSGAASRRTEYRGVAGASRWRTPAREMLHSIRVVQSQEPPSILRRGDQRDHGRGQELRGFPLGDDLAGSHDGCDGPRHRCRVTGAAERGDSRRHRPRTAGAAGHTGHLRLCHRSHGSPHGGDITGELRSRADQRRRGPDGGSLRDAFPHRSGQHQRPRARSAEPQWR